MRKFIKNKKIIFCVAFFILFVSAPTVLALETIWPSSPISKIQMAIGMELPTLIKYFYEWGLALGGIAAFIALVIAGVQYMTSTGNPAAMKAATDRIKSAFLGLVLLLGSWLLLNTINPQLTQLRKPEVGPSARYLAPIQAGKPYIPSGGKGMTSKFPDDSCEAWGGQNPKCDEFCYDSCKMYGHSFGLVVGATPGDGRDEAWCTCYDDPPKVSLEKIWWNVGENCECRGDASPQCGTYCFNQCKDAGYTFGTVAGCKPSDKTDETTCTCFNAPDIKFTGVTTIKVGERCECRGDASPQCGDFCQYYCVEREGYNLGYIPGPEACEPDPGTDVVWCTCLKYEKI